MATVKLPLIIYSIFSTMENIVSLSSSISVIFVLCYAQYFLFMNSLQNIISVSNRNLSSKICFENNNASSYKISINVEHENVCIGIYMILIIVSSTNFSAEIIEYFNGCSFFKSSFSYFVKI